MQWMEAVETFKEMMKLGIQPDDSTSKPLWGCYGECLFVKVEVASMEDTQTGLNSWMSSLFSILGIKGT